MDPFDIFPIKVWEEILDRLEDPLDKWNLIKTNRSLELLELFQEKGTDWHFSSIFKLVLGNFYPRNRQVYTTIEKPWHPKGELKSAVLNCRRVSKRTKKTVDKFVADYWEKYCYIAPFVTPRCLKSLEDVDECLAHAEELNRNRTISPFISGGLLYLLCTEVEYEDGFLSPHLSLEIAAQLVSHPNIGSNLRGIRVKIRFTDEDLQGTCNLLRRLIQSAPNIVTLSILFFPFEYQMEGGEIEVANAFPELPYLKHLEVCERTNDDVEYMRDYVDFSQYFEQLTSLEISISLWKEQYNGGLMTFPQLKSLHLNQIPIGGWERNILEIVQNLNAPALEYFTLETSKYEISQMREEHVYVSLLNCVLGEINPAMNSRTPDQTWKWEYIQFNSSNDAAIICVYIFSKVM